MIREKIDSYLEKALVNYDLPGLCVGIEIGQKSENKKCFWFIKKFIDPQNF